MCHGAWDMEIRGLGPEWRPQVEVQVEAAFPPTYLSTISDHPAA